MYLKSMAAQLWRTLGTSFHPWLVKQALLSVPGTRSSCSWHQESAKTPPNATGKVLQSCFFISEMFMMLKIIIVFININNLQREKQSLQVLPIFHLN